MWVRTGTINNGKRFVKCQTWQTRGNDKEKQRGGKKTRRRVRRKSDKGIEWMRDDKRGKEKLEAETEGGQSAGVGWIDESKRLEEGFAGLHLQSATLNPSAQIQGLRSSPWNVWHWEHVFLLFRNTWGNCLAMITAVLLLTKIPFSKQTNLSWSSLFSRSLDLVQYISPWLLDAS